jgi:putative ABC transport system permease protein
MRPISNSQSPVTDVRPPRWAQRFVEWYCRPHLAEDLIGDLNEYFERNVETIGVRRAKLIYIIDAFKFFRTYTVRTPKFLNLFINWIMIGSYIKTSARSLMRNKLFSSINIVGLAISMSVGLLLIAFVLDLRSYDKFNKKGDRVYRIMNKPSFHKEPESKFASTSIKAGKLIHEKVTGVEEIAMLRRDFQKDAKVGDNILPIEGYFAESSIFRILTFPFIAGNPDTALKDPYSVVLTETAAKKLFGDGEALGKAVRFDTVDYQVTGVMKDVPFFSHITFEALASFSTFDQVTKTDASYLKWSNMWSNYVYVLLPENGNVAKVQAQLDAICKQENLADENTQIRMELQPLYKIVIGEDLSNSIGAHMPPLVLWILIGLASIVILSACFNYTNLSIARAMRRFKEVGLRKAIGAGKSQVRHQFLAEAIIVSLAALVLSFLMFLVLRSGFIDMAPELQRMVKLDLTPSMVGAFIVFSIVVGAFAGFLPAIFFSKINAISALRNTSSVKVFKHVTLRRFLVVVQYTLTLIFITTTAIGYVQYKNILSFDLGYNTENIFNIDMQGNKSDELMRELSQMPEVTKLSRSMIITSLGNYWGGYAKYQDTRDSTLVWYNAVDENYVPLHEHQLIAGTNFISRPTTKDATSEVIVNENLVKRFNVGNNDPAKAIGEEITMDNKKLRIVGVMKDFHYGKVENQIEPVIFTYWVPEYNRSHLNVKIKTTDMLGVMAKIESAWKEIDRVHTFKGKFYNEAIQESYTEFSSMIKVIGFLSFLAISIASMGLFGMVVFTTETRLKEISIRKVMGASSRNLVYLLSRGFMFLLGISALIALPATYLLFDQVILPNFPFHEPIQVTELFVGLLGVLIIAFLMIGSQTMKAARNNPAEVLKSE